MGDEEIYISTDIETNGPIPGTYSMLSFGSAAFRRSDGKMIGTFTRNIELLEGAKEHPKTMAWWSKRPNAWRAARTNLVSPTDAMQDFVQWVEGLPGIKCGREGVQNATLVAYPSGFDFTFMYWYLIQFVGHSPFSFSSLDIKSFAMPVLDLTFRQTSKRAMPRELFPAGVPHTHVALDDAIEQGQLFMSILSASRTDAATLARLRAEARRLISRKDTKQQRA